MTRTKVFVGNLSFKTVEAELAKQFADAGTVISANIITRGPRSLGYGFVEMETEEAAENAVKLLHKKEIDGRPINVEIAKPREEGEEREEGQSGGVRRGGRGRGGFRGRGGGVGVGGGGGGGFPRGRGRGGGFTRQFAVKKPFYKSEVQEDEDEEGKDEDSRQQRPFRRRRRGGRGRRNVRTDSIEKKEESKTTLFVANLPFKHDDEAFGKIFSDLGLSFKSAHVVKKRNGLSKGYGFVEFTNEGDQQKALNEVNNKAVEGRELSVKVALTENHVEEDGETKKEETEEKEVTQESKEEKKQEAPKTQEAQKKQEPVKKTTEAPKKPEAEQPKKQDSPPKKVTESPKKQQEAKKDSPQTEAKKDEKKK